MLFPCNYYVDDYYLLTHPEETIETDNKYYHLKISVDYIVRGRKNEAHCFKESIKKAVDNIYTIKETSIRSGSIKILIESCKFEIDIVEDTKLNINLLCLCNYISNLRPVINNIILSMLNRNIDKYLSFSKSNVSIDDRNKLYIGKYNVVSFS